MTDLSKHTLAELEAEIERRKSEPDWAAWEPKWQTFCEMLGWPKQWNTEGKRFHLRALIATHNTPLTGEWPNKVYRKAEVSEWTEWDHSVAVPVGVSSETHEVEFYDRGWVSVFTEPTWTAPRYRYRPRQP